MNLRLVTTAIALFCITCIAAPPVPGEELASDESPSRSETIRVGGNSSYPPFEFLDKDGNPSGLNVDLFRAIARVMGLKVEFVLGPWHKELKDLQLGKVDVLMGLTPLPERAGTMDFSPPHTLISFSVFGREGAPKIRSIHDLRSRKVIVMRGGRLHDFVMKKEVGTVIPVDTYAEGLRLLASGRYDYALQPTVTGLFLIKELGLKNIRKMNEMPDIVRHCSAVKKGNLDLLAKVNTGMAILKQSGESEEIHDKWLGVLEREIIPLKSIIRFGSIAGTLILALLSISLLWSRMLKKQVDQRTEALSLEVIERQRTEYELRNKQEQLVQASKLAAIGTLVSGVAHEINNPNGLISLNLTMLCEMQPKITEAMEEKFQKEGDYTVGKWQYADIRENLPMLFSESLDASKRVGFIVEDLKNFSRREDSSFNDTVDLNAAVTAAIRLVNTTIKKSTDRFELTLADHLPPVKGNVRRLEQVIVNLIVNACQALSDRRNGISVVTRHDISSRVLHLEVADEGVGIPSEQLQYIIDPFYTTKREQGGTGLGLSISDAIAKDHGGSLTLTSTLGKGTSAILTLPVSESGGLS